MKSGYYSVNEKGKYIYSEKTKQDENGIVKVINSHTSKSELVKFSELRPWSNPSKVTVIRNR